MALRREHKAGNQVARDIGLVVCTAFWIVTRQNVVFVGMLAGLLFFSSALDPDLDVDQKTGAEYELLDYSRILGVVLLVYGWPYAKLILHRSIFSHLPGLGTAIRCVYFVGPMMFLLNYWIDLDKVLLLWLGMFIGLCFTDTAHWMLDRN